VRDVEVMQRRVAAAGAGRVSDVLKDEFGASCCTFDAPDGYAWLLVEA
jgi:hypothetical protein